MKTGATKQQIEEALSRRDERWGYCHCRNCLNELQEWAIDLVDENHRIVSVQLLVDAWTRITAQAKLSDADATLANELKAAVEGDGE